MNILGIDFEEWYHPQLVQPFIKNLKHEPKIIEGITKILELLRKSVIDDVLKLKNHPLVPNSIQIYGYIYDCKTGNLKEVYEATKVGAKLNSST